MNSNKRPVALITGANGGMGRVIAHHLLGSGYRVILSCRPLGNGMHFCKSAVQEFGAGNVDLLEMDLASLDSVKTAAGQLLDRETCIDVLINNAGMLGWEPEVCCGVTKCTIWSTAWVQCTLPGWSGPCLRMDAVW